MRIVRSKMEGVPFHAAKWTGGPIVPEIVVLHDTASRLTPFNAMAYLADNAAKVSVHFVVERDGAITQQVATDRRANHAGQSSFHGRGGCNDFSIGIEIVNPGRMTALDGGRGRAWWGEAFDGSDDPDEALRFTPEAYLPTHGTGVWMHYAEAQLAGVEALLVALFAGVPSLTDITTHWYVSPGRKVDVNPLFPLEAMRARVLGRDDPAVTMADTLSGPPVAGQLRVTTHGSALNLRRWPSYNPNVIGQVPNGTLLPVLRSGAFGDEVWHLVRWDDREGWVAGRYTTPVEARAAA